MIEPQAIEPFIGLVPFIPAFFGFATPVLYLATRNRLIVFSFLLSGLTLSTIISILVAIGTYVTENPLVFKAGGWPAPIGIVYIVDRFSSVLGLVSSFILLLIGLYSVSYIVDDAYPWYAILLLGNAAGVLGVIYTGDLFNLFVMLEVTGVSSYALVMYYRHRADSIVSGLKYAFIGSLGTTLYLLAMGLLYSYYGTLNTIDFSYKLQYITSPAHAYAFGAIMILALWAFSIKSGVFPNHFWLPDAHPAAPTPISALLSGLVVNTGLVGLYKVLYISTWSISGGVYGSIRELTALAAIIMGALSAVFGALLMFIQRDVKRLIAYSTVMNLGYLFMGIGCLTQSGLEATLYYIIVHSLAKATLFMSAGVFIKAAGTRDLDKLAGLGPRYPVAGIALAVSTLTLAGAPPLPGFLAKLLLYEALFEKSPVIAITMIIASAIGLLSYMRLFYTILLGVPVVSWKELDFKCAKVVLLLLSIVIIVVGIVFLFNPDLLSKIIGAASTQSTIDIEKYAEYVKGTLRLP